MSDPRPLQISFSHSILEHLGVNLYSNVPAVLAEVVANSWDADAENVSVDIDPAGDRIVIFDDGSGMTRDEVITRFLNVGYQKRIVEGNRTKKKNRPMMGRKGVGKLSVFAIAERIEVHTAKHGERTAFWMSRADIRKHIKEESAKRRKDPKYQEKPYRPGEDPEKTEEVVDFRRGTRLILEQIDKKLNVQSAWLRKRLARRFGIIGPKYNFEVVINNKPVTATDRDYYGKLEFIWYFGDEDPSERTSRLKHKEPLPNEVEIEYTDGKQASEKISGWIGTVRLPSDIEDVNTAISIIAHGKLVHENILRDIQEARVFAQYVVGEIYADFLDDDPDDDIVTSDRQSLKHTDPRYEAIRKFVKDVITTIGNRWTDLRNREAERRAMEVDPVRDWFYRLKPEQKPYARKLFQNIEKLKVSDERTRRELYKSSLLAFEKLALDDALQEMDTLHFDTEEEFELLRKLFVNIDELEAAQFYQIMRGRLSVVRELDKVHTPEAKEQVIEKHVFDHLWLLDRSWDDPSTEDPELEDIARQVFERVEHDSSHGEVKSRIAIGLRIVAGRHVIVDLRRYDAKLTYADLHVQLPPYRDAFRRALKKKFGGEAGPVEMVCITGVPPMTDGDEEEEKRSLEVKNIRADTFDHLIERSKYGYQEYLETRKDASELIAIIKRLEDINSEVVVGRVG